MIADLHIHYPMHLISDPDEDPTLERMVRPWRRRHPRDWLRALMLEVAGRGFNYRDWSSGHRVDLKKMHYGRVGLGFSVLLDPSTEFDVGNWYGPPQPRYVTALIEQLEMVEEVVAGEERSGWGAVAHGRDELRAISTPAGSRSCTAWRAASTWARPRRRCAPTSPSWPAAAWPT